MRFKQELDTTDLIKTGVLIIGSVIGFILITAKQLEIENLKIKLSIIEKIPDVFPAIQFYYTNQLSKEGDTLKIKVCLSSYAKLPMYVFPPKLLLKSDGGIVNDHDYSFVDLNQFSGIVFEGTAITIDYNVLLKKPIPIDSAFLDFTVQLEDKIRTAQINVYKNLGKDSFEAINRLTEMHYKYGDIVYKYGQNNEWDSFDGRYCKNFKAQ